jgi:hypothetical protein
MSKTRKGGSVTSAEASFAAAASVVVTPAREASITSLADLDFLKRLWWNHSIEARLQVLRFTNQALVQQAWAIQEALYNSELACYHAGIVSQYDEAGQPLVSNGLRHFTFEWSSKDQSAATEPSQALAASKRRSPNALVSTREFIEQVDIFTYIEQQLGGFLVKGVPSLYRKDLASAFEVPPHSWTEYERQILRLVEAALFRMHEEEVTSVQGVVASSSNSVVAIAANPSLGAEAEAAEQAAAALLSEEAALACAAERRAKKKARKKVAAAERKRLASTLAAAVIGDALKPIADDDCVVDDDDDDDDEDDNDDDDEDDVDDEDDDDNKDEEDDNDDHKPTWCAR